jgi:RND family efflux transporter MFP subunit
MNKRSHRSLLAILALLTATTVSTAHAQGEAVVELGTVIEGNNSPVIRLPGTVISVRDSEISAELSGRLTWLAQVGDRVQEGQPLAEIDDHMLQLQLRNDSAAIARTEADIEYNRRQIARLQRLAQQNNMAQSELDAAQSQLEMLRQELRMAEVARDRTRYDLKRSKVTAPFSGVIASRTMNVGEYTSVGTPLLRLVDTEALEISVNAPLRIARFNHPGMEVQVASDNRHAMNSVRGLVPVGDNRSHMMELRLQANAGDWYIGEAVTVELPQGAPEQGINVPRDALVLRNEEVFVYTVSADNTAVKIPVIPGAGHGAYISVDADLAAGAPVVVRGAERLSEGQAIKVIQHHLAAG